ncbi:MAG: TetR/AcrR family transcriptional regulator [Halieaceae bacterium]|jgi:AcrR family transcriptional regulator|nr:TetR/AcrR family transcriptional regulator [Halieaceae bacterium]
MSRKDYHKGNVREGLIEAAERVLHDEGLVALSLRRVAREVGVAPSAVYNHFKNREALLAAVAADGYRQIAELELAAYSGQSKSAAVVRGVARDYLHFAAANPNLYRLMFSHDVVGYRSDPELGQAGDRSFGISVDWWYGSGSYDPGQTALEYPYAMSVWAILHGLALQMIDGLVTMDLSKRESVDKLADTVMDIFLEGASLGLVDK